MKINSGLTKLLMVSISSLVIFCKCSSTRSATEINNTGKALSIKSMVDSQHFTFLAETVNPLRGRYRNLTSTYDVSVSKDSVVAYLPYFGRSRTAPLDPSEAGIKFTSTDFSYAVTRGKNDRWDVLIKPKDTREVQQLNFQIFENGSATLDVTSTSRDPISFNGRVK